MLAQLAPYRFTLAAPRAVRDALYRQFASSLARNAVEALAVRRPALSACRSTAPWQRWALVMGGVALLGVLLFAPLETIRVMTLLLAVLFLPVIALRGVAAFVLLSNKADTSKPGLSHDADVLLPTYTILVPLYGEAHMLPQLVHALLILEAADSETVKAARALSLPARFEIVVVPDLEPRQNRRRSTTLCHSRVATIS